MNKLSKILICIIVILIIVLVAAIYKYFEMKNLAKDNYGFFMNTLYDYYELYNANPPTE